MSVTAAAAFYIILWFLAANWVFFLPRNIPGRLRYSCWFTSLFLVFMLSYGLDTYYIKAPHTAWENSTLYVVFVFISLLMSVFGLLIQKSKTLRI